MSHNIEIVKTNGLLLQYLDEKPLIVCNTALEHNGLALQYVPKDLIDQKMCIKALSQNGLALQFVPERLMNETIITFALFTNGLSLQFVPNMMRSIFYSELAMKNNINALQFVKEEHQTEEMILNAVEKNGLLLQYAGMKSKEACMKAIANNKEAGNYIPEYLENDNDLIKYLMMEDLLKQNGMLLKDFNDPSIEMCKIAVEQNAYALMYVPKDSQTLELCILAISKFCSALQFVKDEFKKECENHIKQNRCNAHEKAIKRCEEFAL